MTLLKRWSRRSWVNFLSVRSICTFRATKPRDLLMRNSSHLQMPSENINRPKWSSRRILEPTTNYSENWSTKYLLLMWTKRLKHTQASQKTHHMFSRERKLLKDHSLVKSPKKIRGVKDQAQQTPNWSHGIQILIFLLPPQPLPTQKWWRKCNKKED